MKLTNDIKQKIITSIQKILSVDTKYKVILFGSYAKGAATNLSDIDIAINGTSPLDTAKWSMIEELLEEEDILQKIDVVDYHRVKTDFQKIIDLEGIKIFEQT
ncbi:MAG: nucleotidyltransferase domain-containing protein [Desulfobacteraceae bacterium]|nr:nucleotidyltransferase domain-containing protein [Desulfobacteraceae bacterium]